MGDDHALLCRTEALDHRRGGLPAPPRRGSRRPVPGGQPALPEGQHRPHHQPRDRQLGKVFNDDPMVAGAMLDRLLHRSVVLNIDGDSYRMRSHRARAEASRQAVAG